jgi:hypothetical protein
MADTEGMRCYSRVEVAISAPLFHLDALPKEGEPNRRIWLRFVTADILDVLTFLSRNDLEKIRLSYQSRRCDNDDGEYAISTVTEVLEATDAYGQKAFICRCKNGKTYVSSMLTGDEGKLRDKATIYRDAT